MRKFLVPIDGSEAALRALAAAIELAGPVPGSSIHLVHVHEEPLIYGEIAVYVPREKMAALQDAHSAGLLDRAEAVVKDAGVPYTRKVLIGPVGRTIAAHAESTGCDAIVMGRHGTTALGDILVGSVAMKVLHLSKLPVILVR
jgi:nucleotide-binding universal stress UspA family protein